MHIDINSIKLGLELILKRNERELGNKNNISLFDQAALNEEVHEQLFNLIEKAAYHVIKNKVLTNTEIPREHMVMHAASQCMIKYTNKKEQEIFNYLESLKDRRLTLPEMLIGYTRLGESKVIKYYFDLFKYADGNNLFVMDGIEREINFTAIGYKLRRAFKEHSFRDEISRLSDDTKRNKLKQIFLGYPFAIVD